MPTLIAAPTRIEAAGNKPKRIDEYIGRVNSQTAALSIGPGLDQFLEGAHKDPRITLFDGPTPVGGNESWPASLGATMSSLGAFELRINHPQFVGATPIGSSRSASVDVHRVDVGVAVDGCESEPGRERRARDQ